ncbi:hypothetical protein BOSP111201_12860 [Bordetella sputigena]|uniref:hypothetical protein n=1 Tax=Bordetella sputigena TaxID=1416810 RepID=UPI0039EFAB56
MQLSTASSPVALTEPAPAHVPPPGAGMADAARPADGTAAGNAHAPAAVVLAFANHVQDADQAAAARSPVLPAQATTPDEAEMAVKRWADKLRRELDAALKKKQQILAGLYERLQACDRQGPQALAAREHRFLMEKLQQERAQFPDEARVWAQLTNGGGITVHASGAIDLHAGEGFNNWKRILRKDSTHILRHATEFHRFVERHSGIPGFATRSAYAKQLRMLRYKC